MSKELWFSEFERLYEAGLEAGLDGPTAYKRASDRADFAAAERFADMADHARLLKKEGKL